MILLIQEVILTIARAINSTNIRLKAFWEKIKSSFFNVIFFKKGLKIQSIADMQLSHFVWRKEGTIWESNPPYKEMFSIFPFPNGGAKASRALSSGEPSSLAAEFRTWEETSRIYYRNIVFNLQMLQSIAYINLRNIS